MALPPGAREELSGILSGEGSASGGTPQTRLRKPKSTRDEISAILNAPVEPPAPIPEGGAAQTKGVGQPLWRRYAGAFGEMGQEAVRQFVASQEAPTYGSELQKRFPALGRYTPIPGAMDLAARAARLPGSVARGGAELGPETAKPLTEGLLNTLFNLSPLLRRPAAPGARIVGELPSDQRALGPSQMKPRPPGPPGQYASWRTVEPIEPLPPGSPLRALPETSVVPGPKTAMTWTDLAEQARSFDSPAAFKSYALRTPAVRTQLREGGKTAEGFYKEATAPPAEAPPQPSPPPPPARPNVKIERDPGQMFGQMAEDLRGISSAQKRFLSERGITAEQAKALPQDKRDVLQGEWAKVKDQYLPPPPRFEKTEAGQQGVMPGAERAMPTTKIRKPGQSAIEDSPLFGQAKAARERAAEEAQQQITVPKQAPPNTAGRLRQIDFRLRQADLDPELRRTLEAEKAALTGKAGTESAIPTSGVTEIRTRPGAFQIKGGFEHGIPSLRDPDDVYSIVQRAGRLKVTEDYAGELRDVSAFFKSKNGKTLDQIAEGLADEFPALGERGAIKEQLVDTLRRYPTLKAEKRASGARAAAHDVAEQEKATEIHLESPPGDVPVSQEDWRIMGPVQRRSVVEFFRDAFTDEKGQVIPGKLGGEAATRVKDDLQALLAPASRGPEASRMAGILRPNLAELARKTERAHALLKKAERWMEGLNEATRLAFIDALETGRVPREGSTAQVLKRLLEQRRKDVQDLGTGKLEHFIEDYFPHLWKDPGKAADAFAQAYGRRPLGGTGAFLKQRTIPTVKDGIALGLEPVTTNPVTATLLKLREMDRYVMAQQVLKEMKDAGLAKLVDYEARAPVGWAKINDKIGRAGSAGQYWAPEPAARLLNNHLSAGLQGNALFDAYRGLGNMLNQMQLGFSAFHLGFVSMDVMQSRVALGLQQLLAGRPIAAAKSVVTAPLAPFTSVLKGSKVLREYYAPGSQGAEIGAVVDRLIQAGGRARMDPFYGGTAADGFLKALRGGRYGTAAAKAWPAMMETLSRPIMQEYVPRAKMGVFADLAQFELSKLRPGTPRSEVVRVLGRAWDSVDNRLGQLVYDNVFWNRTLKDALMASVRSVGWNLGTLRELGGGLGDIPKAIGGLFKGRGFEMTPRMAYTATLPFETAVLGAIIGYLYTGKGPETLKDYFYPKTGKMRPDGSEDRVSLPTYMKDVVAYGTHPWTTVKHKLSPTLSLLSEMLENQDYYGAKIHNDNDPLVRRMMDDMDHILGSAESFSLRNYQQQRKLGAGVGEALPGFIGITPAPASITRTPEQQAAVQARIDRQALAKKRKQDRENPGVLRSIEDRLREAGYLR